MSFLRSLFPDRKLALLRTARAIAEHDLRAAVMSRDTQAINRAQAAMTEATHAQMRHELAVRRG